MIERFHQIERRFIIPAVFAEAALKTFDLFEGREYSVQTIYVDKPERSWSLLNENAVEKWRVRCYNETDSFFEKKIHEGDDTRKERDKVTGIPEGLISVGQTHYLRTEYQIDGVRVTVDRSLLVNQTKYDFVVVEVKGQFPNCLRILKPFENKKFSKYKLLSGKWKPEQK